MTKFLAGAALAVFAVTGANAAIITQTWTGTVTNGTDTGNYFGGGSMIGKAFTATYVFDDTLGTTDLSAGHSLRNAIVSATLKINNITYSMPTFTYSEAYASQEPGFSYLSSQAKVGIDFYFSNTVYDLSSQPYANESFANYSGSVANAYNNNGVFVFGSQLSQRLTLKNSTYSISTVPGAGAVPEPATWAMMIGGFGAVGGAMRYRRRKATVSFA